MIGDEPLAKEPEVLSVLTWVLGNSPHSPCGLSNMAGGA